MKRLTLSAFLAAPAALLLLLPGSAAAQGAKALAPSEPMPVISLKASPKAFNPTDNPDSEGKKPPLGATWLSKQRLASLARRDKMALPHEKLEAFPRQFCYQGRCASTYKEIAAAMYGRKKGADRMPVFCVPQKQGGKWSIDTVHCSKNWIATLGGWIPWRRNGMPNDAPEEGTIPPFACFGNPEFLKKNAVLPAGGAAENSGFHCRKRVFRVLATMPEKSIEDRNKNIVQMCLNLRQQTWGEKYPNINVVYRDWCHSSAGPRNKSLCPRKDQKLPGEPGAPALPFMLLSREELIYFFGHTEFFCRADREGIVHFLDEEKHGKWADTFTCGIGRGVIEGGPFEEGVQVCAMAPYIAEPTPQSTIKDPFKARLHCWKFARPTCETLSQPEPKKEYLYLGNVFDVYDMLKEFRRTRKMKVFEIFDMKDSEKVGSYADMVAFSDTAKDEGAFGVKDFCRFVGDTKHIQCGYTKDSMARWYEMRQGEEPDASCAQGICQKGAYQRGYYCALFRSQEMFKGKPYWMCGIDPGPNGKKKIANARAICIGGKLAREFQSAKGERVSLQCYERRFKWAESSASQNVLLGFSWEKTLSESLAAVGGAGPDQAKFVEWAKKFGHTLGHRTSQRIGLMREISIPAVKEFHALRFDANDVTGLNRTPKGKNPSEHDAKVKDLNDLVYEVVKGDRAADPAWWQELQGATIEDGKSVLTPSGRAKVYGVARRLHQLVRVLDHSRRAVLRTARTYAEKVYAHVPNVRERMSRVEVHQQSRGAHEKLRGNVFCVPEEMSRAVQQKKKDDDEETKPVDFICASSPMLVAGMVEIIAKQRFDREATPAQKQDGRLKDSLRQKLRAQVKGEWCYGAAGSLKAPGMVWSGPNKLAPLYQADLSSPFLMEPGKGVLQAASLMLNQTKPYNWKTTANWLKCTGFGYSDENWEKAVPDRGEAARPTQSVGLQLPPASMMAASPPPSKKGPDTSAANKAIEAAAAGDSRAKKAAEIVSKVGGLVGDLIAMVMPGLGKAISYISNLINEAVEFIEEYKGKFLEASEEQWKDADEAFKASKQTLEEKHAELETAKKTLETTIKEQKEKLAEATKEAKQSFDEEVDKLRETVDEKRDAYQKASEDFAGAPPDAKADKETAKNEAQTEWKAAIRAWNDFRKKDGKKKMEEAIAKATGEANAEIQKAVKELAKAQKAYNDAVKKDEKDLVALIKGLIQVKGSAKVFEDMLTDLANRAAKKVMELIEPQARDLFGKGFRFVRMILGIVAKAIISALASIPFVGGVLAAAGQVAYDFGLNMLEDFCFEQLKGLVERFFATIVRAQLSLVATGLKKTVLRTVQAAHCKNYKHLCPADELKLAELPPHKKWLERAFACQGAIRLPDSVYTDAIAARQRIIRTGRQMKREAPMYARNLADKYFARFGLSYDKWMAAVGTDAREVIVAKAAEINRHVQAEVEKMRMKIRPSRLPD